ncbi:MAG TPA: sugar ABC transporter ATP-binding protein [Fimbriimonadaceae bacterium]|nr:sugar ABC transporter ATP-binding protein [Fimbriimonadaceae bacterium]
MLSLRGVTKRFAGVAALDDVDLELDPGEVVAVIGENGAGKSTLMKVIGGVYVPDAGSMELDGSPISLRSPSDALALGIRVIYQELTVLDNLDIAGNVFLGREKRRGWLLDEREMRAETAQILARVGLNLDPARPLSALSLAERQLVEIARALSMSVRILILDEPTSSLTLEETQKLLQLVGELKAEGVAILYVSHRLDEVHQVADRVVALRDARNAGNLSRDEINHAAMIKLMVGRDLAPARGAAAESAGEARLKLDQLRTQRYPDEAVDLEIRAGEILGMAGLVGAGRSELARAAFGVDRFQGALLVDGKQVSVHAPRDAINAGVYLIPEDRRGTGLTIEMTVRDNVTLPDVNEFASIGLINRREESEFAKAWTDRIKVKTASIETPVVNLSGGNQQKVVLARWLALKPKVLICDEPTRGVDVGAKAEIYAEMRTLADAGVAIWMISSDMEEVLAVSDRIAVMHEGRLAGTLEKKDATEEGVMRLAVGASS